jgi:DNA repair exonuclease SbcCD ATPase subunit
MGIKPMHDDDAPNFKIRLDDDVDETTDASAEEEIPEETPKKEIKNRRIDRSGRKMSLTVFLLAGLACAAVAGVYFSLKNQIAANTNAGATAVTSLSINLESRLTSIGDAQQELDKKLTSDMDGINSRIQKIEKSISAVRTSKSDKADVEKALIDIEKKLSLVQKKLEDIKSEISESNTSTQKKIAGFTQSMTAYTTRIDKANAELSGLHSEIAQLKSDKLTRATLTESLKVENERYMTLIDNLNRELGVLKLRVKALEQSQTQIPYRPGSAAQPPAPEKRGGIIEQPIR